MHLYNTLTRKIEKFIPYNKEKVNLYTCGPTVYNFAHIGNLRSYIMEDILQRTLEYLGYNVNRVMNITDVGHLTSDADEGEDKMVKGAIREKKTVLDIADYYTDAFLNDMESLNLKIPKTIVKASSYIDRYIHMIEVLLEKGYAYLSFGNVYFDTSKLDNYYALTNCKEEEMAIGVREGVTEDKNKKNKTDFVLWFTKSKFENQELKWDSPWGLGYPGWHIECSAISIKNCGEYLDIHCGGVDNIFPHHTNEIAQSESYLGHPWCKYWFHVEHLNNQNGKMSKSSGEFLTIKLLNEKGYNPSIYKMFCLQSHYRKQLIFSYETLDNVKISYNKLKAKISSLKKDLDECFEEEKFNEYKIKFSNALKDDLNTSYALTVLYDVLKSDLNNFTKLKLVEDFDKVFMLDLLKEETEKIPTEVALLIEKRSEAKKNKDFALADSLRKDIFDLGYNILDTREGVKVEKIK